MITTMATHLASNPVLAELAVRWHRDGDGWFPLFPLVPLFFIGAWVLLLTLVFRRRWRTAPGQSGESVLAEGFARGEIDEAEYRDRRAVLRERNR